MSAQVAIVAGAGGALGRVTATTLAARGFTVVAVDRNDQALRELPSGIRVNAIVPQLLATAANRANLPPEALAHAVAPEAIAEVIAFLVSDAAAPVSGAIVPAYGA